MDHCHCFIDDPAVGGWTPSLWQSILRQRYRHMSQLCYMNGSWLFLCCDHLLRCRLRVCRWGSLICKLLILTTRFCLFLTCHCLCNRKFSSSLCHLCIWTCGYVMWSINKRLLKALDRNNVVSKIMNASLITVEWEVQWGGFVVRAGYGEQNEAHSWFSIKLLFFSSSCLAVLLYLSRLKPASRSAEGQTGRYTGVGR